MKRWMTPLATIAGTTVMLASARGQAAPTPAQGTPSNPSGTQAQKSKADSKPAVAPQTQKSDAKASKTDDDAEPTPLYNSITLGYKTWSSSGYLNGLSQHGFVPGGFSLEDLSLFNPYSHENYTAFELTGNPGDDFGTRLLSQWGAQTSLRATAHQFSYWDPSFGTLEPSRKKDVELTLDHQISQNFGVFATYQDANTEQHFPAPLVQPNFNNRTFIAGAQKQVGATTIGTSFSETRYTDQSQTQPTTLTDHGEIRYLGNWGSRLTAEGSAGVSRIQQQGQPDNWIHDYAISGIYDLTDSSTLGAHWGQSILDLHSIQNAYVRKRLSSGLNYDGRLGAWAFGLGLNHREEERVRSDHSYVDVPTWDSYNMQLNGRLSKQYRFGLKSSIENLTSAPTFLTDDPTLLYWGRKAMVQAKLSGGNETTNGYVSYTYRYRRNPDRDLSLSWVNFSLGGSRVFTKKLLGYAEFSSDRYSTGGASAIDSSLSGYFPTSETFSVGLDFTRNIRESFSFVITSFYTQDQWGQQIALSYRKDLGKDRSFQITYSPWLQRDRLYDVDSFDARILTMKFGTRF